MIGLVDYGAGNLSSVRNAFGRLCQPVKTVRRPEDLDGVNRLVLPGVGHFGAAVERLTAAGLRPLLESWVAAGRPLLGVCLGMQLLFEESEEDGGRNPGLGVFSGRVVRMRGPRRLHLGWNAVSVRRPEGGLTPGFYYFVHEFAPRPGEPSSILAESRFGRSAFPAAVGRGPVLGVQFHPEKSGAAGLEFLRRWAGGEGSAVSPEAAAGPGAKPAVRIIPCLDMDDGRVVKGVRFKRLRDAGDPVERARVYNSQGADELCFLDVGATWKNRRPLLDVVERVAREVFIPLTVGGGLDSIAGIRDALNAGADKVALGTAAVENPGLLNGAAGRFGRQCLVVSIDARAKNGGWTVMTHGGRRDAGLEAAAWARRAEAEGAGEILLNSVDRDGTGLGFDLALLRRIRAAVRLPVIASGGGRDPSHALAAVADGGAEAVLLASVFHDGRRTVADFKSHLQRKGVFIR